MVNTLMALYDQPPILKFRGTDTLGIHHHIPSEERYSAMAYPYNASSSEGNETSLNPSSYMHPYEVPTVPSTGPINHQFPPPPNGSESSSQAPRRSMSYPYPGNQHPGFDQNSTVSQADKKKNKLGYHRTSIACSHCRRRKIRCIPSSDSQSMCQNCIRLKKSCSFHPTDQQFPSESHHKASSRASTGSKVGGSPSLSPESSVGNPIDTRGQQSVSSSTRTSFGGMASSNILHRPGDGLFERDPPSASSTSSRSLDFSSHPGVNWSNAAVSSQSVSRPGDLNTTWRPYPGEALSAQFPSYGHGGPSSPSWASGIGDSSGRDGAGWSSFPAPIRSMSYSGESTGGHQHPPVAMAHDRPFDRRASDFAGVCPGPINPPIPSMATSAALPANLGGQVAARVVPSQGPSQWQPHSDFQRYPSYHASNEDCNTLRYREKEDDHEVPPSGPPPSMPEGRTGSY